MLLLHDKVGIQYVPF